jgi:Rrf2 family protein
MRISAKSRYALAAVMYMTIHYNNNNKECITVINISEQLGISKIYLEQVFSLLKRAKIVISIKGAQGGYRLAKPADRITVADVLHAVEQSIFEPVGKSVSQEASYIEHAMQHLIWDRLDKSINDAVNNITLSFLANEAEKQKNENIPMFYI